MSVKPLPKQDVPGQKLNSQPGNSWSSEAHELARQARSANILKLAPLIRKLQRISGHRKRECINFVLSHIDDKSRLTSWTDSDIDRVRELAPTLTTEEIAKKIGRSSESIRCMCKRNRIRLRDIRCDVFSISFVAAILHVRHQDVRIWIDQGWLEANIIYTGRRKRYQISPEALQKCLRIHKDKLRILSMNAFRAYCDYCFVPKHTIDEQLLQVRQAKREQTAFDLSREEQE